MDYAYPCLLTHDNGDASCYLVTFPDLPEALTAGATREESLSLAEDALLVALSMYVDAEEDIPRPSPASAEHHLITVPPRTAAQLALYTAMRRKGVSARSLARSLGVREAKVRRLLDLDRPSRLDYIAAVLHTLGRRLVVGDRPAPESSRARATVV